MEWVFLNYKLRFTIIILSIFSMPHTKNITVLIFVGITFWDLAPEPAPAGAGTAQEGKHKI
jgi:hypothetical protein